MNRFSSPFIIDIEASGFGDASYPIEVGVALDEGTKFCTLISPEPDWTHWDEEAEKIHHVSRELLKTHGKTVHEVTQHLNNLLNGKTLYSDGWVVDHPWLIRLFSAAGKAITFHVSPLEIILTEAQMAIWHQTKDQVIEELNLTRHRASNDAWIIQETFRKTFVQVNKQQRK
jgi:hypothetical protein